MKTNDPCPLCAAASGLCQQMALQIAPLSDTMHCQTVLGYSTGRDPRKPTCHVIVVTGAPMVQIVTQAMDKLAASPEFIAVASGGAVPTEAQRVPTVTVQDKQKFFDHLLRDIEVGIGLREPTPSLWQRFCGLFKRKPKYHAGLVTPAELRRRQGESFDSWYARVRKGGPLS